MRHLDATKTPPVERKVRGLVLCGWALRASSET